MTIDFHKQQNPSLVPKIQTSINETFCPFIFSSNIENIETNIVI